MAKCICKLVFLPTKRDIKPNETRVTQTFRKSAKSGSSGQPLVGSELREKSDLIHRRTSRFFEYYLQAVCSFMKHLYTAPHLFPPPNPTHVTHVRKGLAAFPSHWNPVTALAQAWLQCKDGDNAPVLVRLAVVQEQPLACDCQFPLYPAGISHNLEEIVVVFCLFASHSSSSLPAAALYSPAVPISLKITSSTDLSPQIPSSIISHYQS